MARPWSFVSFISQPRKHICNPSPQRSCSVSLIGTISSVGWAKVIFRRMSRWFGSLWTKLWQEGGKLSQLRDKTINAHCYPGFPGASVNNLSTMQKTTCNAGDEGSIPGPGRFPVEGNGNPLQDSCLGNTMDRGAWKAIVCEVPREKWLLGSSKSPHWGVGSDPLLQPSSSSFERSPSLLMASSLGLPPPGTKPWCSLVRPSNHYFSKRSMVHLGVHAIVWEGNKATG